MTVDMTPEKTESAPEPVPPASTDRRGNMPVYDAGTLFGTARTVLIRHAGAEYRLCLTRQNKLILTK